MKTVRSLGLLLISLLVIVRCSTDSGKNNKNKTRLTGPQANESLLIPTNQLLRPAGFQIQLPGRPVDMALSSNGKWLAVLNINSLDLIRVLDCTVIQRLPIRKGGSYNGVAFSSDGRKILCQPGKEQYSYRRIRRRQCASLG